MDRLIRGYPALVLAITGVAWALFGLVIPGVLVGTSPVPGAQVTTEMTIFSFAAMLSGIAVVWVAIGVWRVRPWRTFIGLVVSMFVFANLVSALYRSLNHVRDHYVGHIALVNLAYLACIACLVVILMRDQPPTDESGTA